MNVGELCKRDAATVSASDSITTAARMMREKYVGMLVVVGPAPRPGNVVPIGVVTDRDIMLAVVADGADASSITVKDVMTAVPATAMLEDLLPETLQQMRRIGVRRLPVVGAFGHFAGVICVDDILAVLASEMSTAAGALVHLQPARR